MVLSHSRDTFINSILGFALIAATSLPSAAAATDIRIVSGQARQNGAVVEEIFKAFNAGQDDVKVTFELDNRSDLDTTQKVLADIVAGSVPDAVRVTGAVLRAYADSGRAQPLDDCLASAPELASQLDQDLLEGFKVDGKLYAMPWYTTLPALYINADAFKVAGLDPEKVPQTWSELKEMALALSDADKGRYGALLYMPNTYLFETYLLSAGGQMLDSDGNPAVNSPEARAVMQFLRDLVAEGAMPAIAPSAFWGQFAAQFQSGNIAMLMSSTSSYPVLAGQVGFEVKMVPVPVKEGGARKVAASSNGFVMLATEPERQKATCQALLSLITPENVAKTVKATASAPHNLEAVERAELLGDYYRANPAFQAINAQPNARWYALPGQANNEFQAEFADIQFEILTGALTVEEGLTKLNERMGALLEGN